MAVVRWWAQMWIWDGWMEAKGGEVTGGHGRQGKAKPGLMPASSKAMLSANRDLVLQEDFWMVLRLKTGLGNGGLQDGARNSTAFFPSGT